MNDDYERRIRNAERAITNILTLLTDIVPASDVAPVERITHDYFFSVSDSGIDGPLFERKEE